jgi:DNA-binding MarR family transcriptional regulator
MAATCSESGLKAMSDAMQLQDKSAIHTVDGHWLMQVYPVEVTHARQRSLTLLEHYILKAFNAIPGCTARDIINQFGLDPLLVDSTLRSLKLCNTIDSVEEAD